MPKIDIYRNILIDRIGKKLTIVEIEKFLELFKAEIDEYDPFLDKIKIEFNDTNRPDLWSCSGLARQIRTCLFSKIPSFSFFSRKGDNKKYYGEILLDNEISKIRPFIFGFLAKGLITDEKMLDELIQLQEKLCQNYGQKRKRVSMGMYNASLFEFPISYVAASPSHKFIPLGMEDKLSLLEINEKHPKGLEYSFIVNAFEKYPLLLDAKNKVISYPPIVNSNDIGSLKVGDTDLFVEVTGIDFEATLLSLSLVACDFNDIGFKVFPVKTSFYENHLEMEEIVCPYSFQEEVEFNVDNVNKLLGTNLTLEHICLNLRKMGVNSYSKGSINYVVPPVYRNDFLHEVDVIEDVMIGEGLVNFNPELPKSFTIGRLSVLEEFSRKIKCLMVGMGFQEMIYNYIGSSKDFIDKMNSINSDDLVKIANPMTESYEYIRSSIIPNLLKSESVSSNFPYPHKIFEIGKVVIKDLNTIEGTITFDNFAFLMADKEISFNEINSVVASFFYYLNVDIKLRESDFILYIKGRGVDIMINESSIGSFGEVSPYILSNFGIFVPCTVFEININKINIT